MLFYTADFISPVFFPSIFPVTDIASELLPRRNEVKNARQTKSRWLVALLFLQQLVFLHCCL
jgi:hypothetical protein